MQVKVTQVLHLASSAPTRGVLNLGLCVDTSSITSLLAARPHSRGVFFGITCESAHLLPIIFEKIAGQTPTSEYR